MSSHSGQSYLPERVLQSTKLLQRVVRGYLTRKKLMEAKALYKTILEELEDDQLQLTWKHCTNFCWPKAFIKLRANERSPSVPKPRQKIIPTNTPYPSYSTPSYTAANPHSYTPTNPRCNALSSTPVTGAGDIDDLLSELSDLVVPSSPPGVASSPSTKSVTSTSPTKPTTAEPPDTKSLSPHSPTTNQTTQPVVDECPIQCRRVTTKHSISQPILSNQSACHSVKSYLSQLSSSVKSSLSSPLDLHQTSKIPIKRKPAVKIATKGKYASDAHVKPINRRTPQNRNLSDSKADIWLPPGVPARAADGTIKFLDGNRYFDRYMATSQSDAPGLDRPVARQRGVGVYESERRSCISNLSHPHSHEHCNLPLNFHNWPKTSVSKCTNTSPCDNLARGPDEVVVERADKETSPASYNTNRSPAKADLVTLYKEISIQTEFLDAETPVVPGACMTPPTSHERTREVSDVSPPSESVNLHSSFGFTKQTSTRVIKKRAATEVEGITYNYGTQTDQVSEHLQPPDSIRESTLLISKVTPPFTPRNTLAPTTTPTAGPEMSAIPADITQVPDVLCQPLDLSMSPSKQQPPARPVTATPHGRCSQQMKSLVQVPESLSFSKDVQGQGSPIVDDHQHTKTPKLMSNAADGTMCPPNTAVIAVRPTNITDCPPNITNNIVRPTNIAHCPLNITNNTLCPTNIAHCPPNAADNTVRPTNITDKAADSWLEPLPDGLDTDEPLTAALVTAQPSIAIKAEDDKANHNSDVDVKDSVDSFTVTENTDRELPGAIVACPKPPVTPEQIPPSISNTTLRPNHQISCIPHDKMQSVSSPIAEGDNTSIWNETVSEMPACGDMSGVDSCTRVELGSVQDSLSMELMWIEQAITSRKQLTKENMNELAPKLDTVESLLASNSLPLLVQRRNGDKLLLHESKRLPAVICNHSKAQSHFIVPLNNTGYFGAITEADAPTLAYQCLRDAVSDKCPQGGCKVLPAGDSTSAIEYIDGSKKSVKVVVSRGQVLSVTEADQIRCPKLTPSTLDLALWCCLSPTGGRSSDNVTCCRDDGRHLHIQSKEMGSYYRVSDNAKHGLKANHAYSIQDIAQHRRLPCMVSCLYHSPSPRDEYSIPSVFSLLKIISCEVVFAYVLNSDYHPQPSDLIELSIYSTELFAIAESAVVNTEAIRQAPSPSMSIRKAIPGITISYDDYYDVTKQSKELPPPLPTRPAGLSSTVRLTRTQSFNEKSHNQVKYSEEVMLPTRTPSQRSIIQKFGTLLKPKSSRPTVQSILEQFHAKQAEKENLHHQNKSNRSVRGLAISGPMSGSEEIIDLSKPLRASDAEQTNLNIESVHKTDTISTSSSFCMSVKKWEDPMRYEHMDRTVAEDSESAYETAPCSEDLTVRNSVSNRDSSVSSFYNDALLSSGGSIRISDESLPEPQLRNKEEKRSSSNSAKRTSIRSLREAQLQVAKQANTSDASDTRNGSTTGPIVNDTSAIYTPISCRKVQSNKEIQPTATVTSAITKETKTTASKPFVRSSSATTSSNSDYRDHVTELRKRFSDITLKPVLIDQSQPAANSISSAQNKQVTRKAVNHTQELKDRLSAIALRIDGLTSNADASWESVESDYLSPNRHTNHSMVTT